MSVSGYSPRSLGGIALHRGARTYRVKFRLWGYVEVDAGCAEDAQVMAESMSIPELLKEVTVTDTDIEEPEEVE